MGTAVMKRLRFADTQESCFEAWKRSHMGCAALICGRFYDAQELRFRLRIIQKWAVPLRIFFDIIYSQESRFQSSKRSNMGCAALLCGRFADAQESRIQDANRSKMGSAVLKFADAQESLIQVAKRSNVGSTVMKGLRFADSQESRFQASKRSNILPQV